MTKKNVKLHKERGIEK